MDDNFSKIPPDERLRYIKDICSVYTELLKYPPFEFIFKATARPDYSLIGREMTSFLRNLLLHFPYYRNWSEIGFDKSVITTFEKSGTIDKFLSKEHSKDIKYRFWDSSTKKMTYVQLHLDSKYRDGEFIMLNSIISEGEGVKFLCIFMKDVLMTQVDNVSKISE